MKIKYWLKFFGLVIIQQRILVGAATFLLALLTIIPFMFPDLFKGWPYWVSWLLILFIGLWYLTFSWAFRKWKGELESNWIKRYELESGKLPALPDYLEVFVINYTSGEPVHKKIEVIGAGVQSWNRLNKKQQEMLKGLIEWLGGDPMEYVERIYNMAPPSGKNKGLEYKR